jgi:hypothetical protein
MQEYALFPLLCIDSELGTAEGREFRGLENPSFRITSLRDEPEDESEAKDA